MASQDSIIREAIRIANGVAVDPHSSPVIDNSFLYEDLFSDALREAVKESPKNSKRTYAITFSSGEAALPDTVLDEFLDDSTLQITGDNTLLVSYEPRYEDYLRSQFSYNLSYYTVQGNKILFRAAGQNAGASNAAANLTTVGIPDIPTTITDSMAISAEIADLTAVKLARMVRGGAND